MNYSPFELTIDPDQYDQYVVDNGKRIIIRRADLIRDHVRENNLIPLQCGYFGLDSYYYHNETKTMYKVCNIYNRFTDISFNPTFEVSTDAFILALNNLKPSM